MLKKLLPILLITALFTLQGFANWKPLAKNSGRPSAPHVELISDSKDATVLKFDFTGFEMKELQTESGSYQMIDLLSEMFTTRAGYPELPYMAKVLAVPDQAVLTAEVVETGEVHTIKGIRVQPARESWIEGEKVPPYVENTRAYSSSAAYPENMFEVEKPVVFRDFRMARVSVFPVRYIAAENELQVVSSITIKVTYSVGKAVNPKNSPKRKIAPSFGSLYRSTIFNYPEVLNREYDGKEEGDELMLCIMPDEFVDEFQEYAQWNRQTGTDISITPFSEIGANSSNPDIIKNHITDAYYNWETPPTYVLIIGDDGVFPKEIVTYPDYSFAHEEYFVTITGDDYFPEIMIGRFTNQGEYRLQVMINKYMMYEREPYIEDTDWFTKGVCCSNNDYASQVETKRFTYSCMVDDGGFTHVDTLMSDGNGWGWGCSMGINDILEVLEEGRSFLNYRGEGWSYGWYASCYDFSTSDVYSINNGEKFTFVTSIGCGVAMFDVWGEDNCYGEAWIEMGTLDNPRGGVGFIGPTSNTHTTYNNRIDKGIYVGMFREGMDTPGQAMQRGKLYMYNVFGNEYWVEYHYKVFCVLGDPSLHIWKKVPREVNMDYSAVIPVGYNQLEVNVTYADNGAPVDSAVVVISGDNLLETGVCDENGTVTIEIVPEQVTTLTITARGGDVYPLQGTIEVIQPEELVEPEGQPVIVDINGNTDGLVNPNENCTATFTLKNWGELTVNNVEATLSSPDTNIQVITTNAVSYGNMDPQAMVTGDPFQFYVRPDCPVGHEFTLHLDVTSTISSWQYDFTVLVHGCNLQYDNYLIDDTGEENMNYRLDPGETVDLYISVINTGDDFAPNVAGILSSNDPYIIIEDAESAFGTLDMGDSSINTENYFVVNVNASCPTEYMAECSILLYTQDGNYPFETTALVELPVTLLVGKDYTGPDEYGYYAYSSGDAFFDQKPDYEWMEIDGSGNVINFTGQSDYTETVDLPFTFTYYGQDYNQIRISTDGWMAFGSGTQTAPVNYALPHNDDVNAMVAVFWDDLYDPEFLDGDIYYYHDAEYDRFIVEWDSLSHNNAGPEPIREVFQVMLLNPETYETPTGDGEIIVQYRKIEDCGSNTIGIENHAQDIALQYVCNDDYVPTASSLEEETAIKFTTEPPFVSVVVSTEEIGNGPAVQKPELLQNNPNPFQSDTRISYFLPSGTQVKINVYNIRGELVNALFEGFRSAGVHSLHWDGRNQQNQELGSGIYFYQLQTDETSETKKMFLLR